MLRPLLERVGVLSIAVASGCGSDPRPDPAGDSTSVLEGDPTALAHPDAVPDVCEPPAYRECRAYHRDGRGQLNCPIDFQICRSDGAGWLPCGEYDFGVRNEPVRRGR